MSGKVRLETDPLHDTAQLAARADAIADLLGFLQEAPADEALLASLLDDLRPLADKAPRELLADIPALEAIRQGSIAELVKAVTPDLLAHLADSN